MLTVSENQQEKVAEMSLLYDLIVDSITHGKVTACLANNLETMNKWQIHGLVKSKLTSACLHLSWCTKLSPIFFFISVVNPVKHSTQLSDHSRKALKFNYSTFCHDWYPMLGVLESNLNMHLPTFQSFEIWTTKPVGVWMVLRWPDPIRSRRWNLISRGEKRRCFFSKRANIISLYFLRFRNERISFLPWI